VRVTRIGTRVVRIPLERPYVFASHATASFCNVLLTLDTDAGIRGIGEASFSGSGGNVNEETPETAKVAIDTYLAPAVVGEDPFDIERIHEKLDHALPRNLIAKSGIDLALWDAMGKAVGLPAYKLLGGARGDARIRCTYTLSIDTPDNMARQAALRCAQGYRTVVVKIGRDPEHDVERVRCVREAVGDEVRIRLDANEGYRPDQAIRLIGKMERYDPEFVEEPVRQWDVEGMALVARSVGVPISSDESNSTVDSVMRIIDRRAAAVLNLKVSKNGGLHRAKRIASIAEAAGLRCIVGGNTTYEIGRQASRHLQLAIPQVEGGSGSEGCAPASQSKVDDVTTRSLGYDDVAAGGGYVEPIPGDGLGIELDEAKVRRYAVA
jgi:L-alanine-DL-glutamate epimerase-like enolase superfamily enzyme